MPTQSAVYDESLSFYRYLNVGAADRDWGLYLTGAGHEVTTFAADGSPKSSSSSYRWDWSDKEVKLTFDPSYPEPYQFEWGKGRTFVDEYAFVYLKSGPPWLLETEATRKTIQVPSGSVILLFPGVWHRYRPAFRGQEIFSSTQWCVFGGKFAQHWQHRNVISPQRPVSNVGGDPALLTCFRRLHGIVRSGQPVGLQQSLAGSIIELLGKADAASRIEACAPFSVDLIQKAREILEDVTGANVRLEHVAQLLNLPYSQFRRSFRLATGLSPHQFRMQAILRQAKELLQSSDLSITQIAMALHFSDPYYFAKAFKRLTGTTPSAWRASFQHPGTNDFSS